MSSPPNASLSSSRLDAALLGRSTEDSNQLNCFNHTASSPYSGSSEVHVVSIPLIGPHKEDQDHRKRTREEESDPVASGQPVAGSSNSSEVLGDRVGAPFKRQRIHGLGGTVEIQRTDTSNAPSYHTTRTRDDLSNQSAGPSSNPPSQPDYYPMDVDTVQEGSDFSVSRVGPSSSTRSMNLANLLNPTSRISPPLLVANSSPPSTTLDSSQSIPPPVAEAQPEPLSAYTCPICFSAPTHATMTPCGHVCCGECLFTAVKASIQRAIGHVPAVERAKCPVCRAPIPGWDGQGGGVVGLRPRVKVSYTYGGSNTSSRKHDI